MLMVDDRSDVAAILKKTRTTRGLSYRQAADKLDLSVSAVYKVENYEVDPRWSTVVKILQWTNGRR